MIIESKKSSSARDVKITKEFIEWFIIIIFFIFSFINQYTLLIAMLMLLILLRQKEIGCIKILNLVTLRTIINPGIAVEIGQYQTIKWIILFMCSLYLLISYFKTDERHKTKLNKVIKPIILFGIYNIIIAFTSSSLPIVASFKNLSYIIIFVGIIIGVNHTKSEIDWLNWMLNMLKIFVLSSLLLIYSAIGYLRNGVAFQGISNQPNMFGIVIAIFVALTISKMQVSRSKLILEKLLIFLSLYMIYLSRSRTSLITVIVLLLIYLLTSTVKDIYKVLSINIACILTVLFFYFDNSMKVFLETFLSKGNEDILYSRAGQVTNLLENFFSNPFFGKGFAVPVLPFKSYIFNFDYIVEPGNLILSVLSYSGIVGFLIFFYYMFTIFWINKKEFKNVGFLFIVPIMISMGEMVFFSSNNIGIWCYMMLAIYVI